MTRTFRPRARRVGGVWVAGLVALLGVTGCGDRNGPSQEAELAVTLESPSVEIVRGEEAPVRVTISRAGGASGPITLEVLGTPAGVTADIGTNPVVSETVTVTLRVGADAATGSYPLTMRASAAGTEAGTAALELRITRRQDTAVAVSYCTATAPDWVAFQNGDGAWQRADAEIAGGLVTFRHEFSADRAGMATLSPLVDGAITVLRVVYSAPAELAGVGDTLSLDCPSAESRTWHGTVLGLLENEKALISTGVFQRTVLHTSADEFLLPGVPAGPQDVLLTRLAETPDGTTLNGFMLRRDVDAADESQLPPFDVTSQELFAPATATLTILGAGAEPVFSETQVFTANSRLVVPFLVEHLDATTRQYFALPPDRLRAGDLQALHLSTAAGPNATNRTTDTYFRLAADRTLALGAPMVPPTVSTSTASGALLAGARFAAQAGYQQYTSVLFEQAAVSTFVLVTMTDRYAGRQEAGYSLAMPDLTAVEGFDPAWRLRPGAPVTWSASRFGGTVPFGNDATPVDGAVRRTAFLQGTIPAP